MSRAAAGAACPVCGAAIDGIDADRRATISPCGHSGRETTLRRILQTHE